METFTVTFQMPGGPVVVERGVTRAGADTLRDTIMRHGGVGRVNRDPTEAERRQARRDELMACGLARAARGRYYAMIQSGVLA